MPTTVMSVRGKNRLALRADPSFRYIGRACAGWSASPFANPFKPGTDVRDAFRVLNDHGITGVGVYGTFIMTPDLCVQFYARLVRGCPAMMRRLPELRGKCLGCWCCFYDGVSEPMPLCHGAVLARMANGLDAKLS